MSTARPSFFVVALAAFVLLEAVLILFVDRPVSLYVRQLGLDHPAIPNAFRAITDLALGKWYIWPSGVGTLAGLVLLRLPRLSAARRVLVLRLTKLMGFIFACTAGSGLIVNVIKGLVGRARPKLLASDAVYGFHPLSTKWEWHAFPSGHSTTAFALACGLMVLFPRFRLPLLAFAVLMALSRVMVNAHYVGDVVAGAALGWVSVYAAARVFAAKGCLLKTEADLLIRAPAAPQV